jgi:N-acetylneuraminate synthase
VSVSEINIGGTQIGGQLPVVTIAEVGMAHDGSLGAAHAYVDAVAECGATAVKFQTHIADQESTSQERFRVQVFPQDATRYDYWSRTEFSKEQWIELAEHAKARNVIFLSSAFSALAVEWLMECEVPAWKVASGELTNFPMLQMMAETGKPLLISSGMSNWRELDETLEFIARHNGTYAIFQCTTSYPCPPEKWGLNVIPEMIRRYGCPVGLSDHSGSIVPGIAAVALGAAMLEFHVAFSKRQFGPDAPASLTLEQVTELVQGVKQLKEAMNRPCDKDAQAQLLRPLHDLFTKSVVAARSLSAGHVVAKQDLAYKKPGTGISAKLADQLVGKTLKRDVPSDHFFADSDFQ